MQFTSNYNRETIAIVFCTYHMKQEDTFRHKNKLNERNHANLKWRYNFVIHSVVKINCTHERKKKS